MISEQIDDSVDGLSHRERISNWSSATSDSGALSNLGIFAWVPSDPTNVAIRMGSRLMIIRGVSPNLFLPTWIRPTMNAMVPIMRLAPGWDLAGGRAIEPTLVIAAIRNLSRVMEYGSPAPSVVPTSVGGIQFEWHMGGIDLEINVSPTGDPTFEFEAGGEEVEGKLPNDVGVLADLISRLPK